MYCEPQRTDSISQSRRGLKRHVASRKKTVMANYSSSTGASSPGASSDPSSASKRRPQRNCDWTLPSFGSGAEPPKPPGAEPPKPGWFHRYSETQVPMFGCPIVPSGDMSQWSPASHGEPQTALQVCPTPRSTMAPHSPGPAGQGGQFAGEGAGAAT